jgi:hypothetical protein
MLPCPVDGGFGPWSPWSKCSASCGIGEKSRLRECNNPVPANGGKYCSDLDFQSSVCNVTKCPGMYPLPNCLIDCKGCYLRFTLAMF